MGYQEFQPHHSLRPYIDAYWVMKSEGLTPASQRIYPDGCIDIILNLGGEFLTDNGSFKMKGESAYLVGTMTRYIDITRLADTYVLGIRFKPMGFSAFFKYSSLHEITGRTIEFNKSQLPEIHAYNDDTIAVLNKFFAERLSNRTQPLIEIIDTIRKHCGKLSIDRVARQHFVSARQLERNFKYYLGISPKEYANFVRYQSAFELIKKRNSRQNLLYIALATGFYDHAHLTNEIKKYSGLLPSDL